MENKNLKNIINEYIKDTECNIRQLEKEILHIIYQYSLMSNLTPEDVDRVESTRAKIMELKDILDDLHDKKDKYNVYIKTPYGLKYKTQKRFYTLLRGINSRGDYSCRVFIIGNGGDYVGKYIGSFIDDLAVEIIKEYEEKEGLNNE